MSTTRVDVQLAAGGENALPEAATREANLQAIVNEGEPILIDDLKISGNEVFSSLRLRTQLTTQEAVASATTDLGNDYVRLYKALGGGWTPDNVAASVAADEDVRRTSAPGKTS